VVVALLVVGTFAACTLRSNDIIYVLNATHSSIIGLFPENLFL